MKSDYPGQLFTLHEANNGVPDDCRRIVREVIEQHGRLDILVNNAGITIDRTVAKMTDGDWQKVIDVNLSGTFFMSQAALPHMIERGTGRIISISSLVGEIGNVGQANYAASKAGIFGLTKTLAKEAYFQLGRAKGRTPTGRLTVNAVTPGFVATEMVAAMPGGSAGALPQADPGRPPRQAGGHRPPGGIPGCRRVRRTSPDRSGPSTADWTCERGKS